ncbi:hypothetical protein ALC57_10700 [Trachymyrmex cornetzi]|uniref:Uncharacterized protein n=1 Tax=Trachymyrmex cornetzi TaxID=471704 RepID=A0A151J3M6_9HYME|nr:hypothetical protein ALC57_10700 [Trachymyrmex cornetzi]
MVDEKLAPSGRDGAKGAGDGSEIDAHAERDIHGHTIVRMWVPVVYRYARGASACRAIRESAARRTEGKIRDTSDHRHRDGSDYSSLFQRENLRDGERREM